LDILEEVVHALGHRLKLESVAMATLGEGKSGSGLDAIWYYKNQEWEKLIKYCLDDVRVTKEVYEYGQRHGNLWFDNRGQRQSIPIRWQQDKSIPDLLLEAMKFGQRLNIDYLGRGEEKRQQLEVDVQDVKGNKLSARRRDTNEARDFDLARIFNVDILGQAQSFQGKLF
jgi:hypothetical protein